MKELRIVTTATGFFKPGLKGKIVDADEREICVGQVGHEVIMLIPEFTIELDNNGGRREFCQYGRDFRFDTL